MTTVFKKLEFPASPSDIVDILGEAINNNLSIKANFQEEPSTIYSWKSFLLDMDEIYFMVIGNQDFDLEGISRDGNSKLVSLELVENFRG